LQRWKAKLLLKTLQARNTKRKTERVEPYHDAVYNFYSLYNIRINTRQHPEPDVSLGKLHAGRELQFNYKLNVSAAGSIDYVIVHELCHLKEHIIPRSGGRARYDSGLQRNPEITPQYVMQEG